MRKSKRLGLAALGIVGAVALGAQPAHADYATYNSSFWYSTCSGGVSTVDVRDFRSLLQQDPWQPTHRYASYPDSFLRAMLNAGCKAFEDTLRVDKAMAAAFGL